MTDAAPSPYDEGLDLGREMRRQGHARPLLLTVDAHSLGYKPGRQWDLFRRGMLDAWGWLR